MHMHVHTDTGETDLRLMLVRYKKPYFGLKSARESYC